MSDAKPSPTKRIYRTRQVLKDANVLPKPGPLSTAEKSTISSVAVDGELVQSQIDALAVVMRREPSTVAKYVESAREIFQKNASKYADIHLAAAEKAIALGDSKALDVARKAAEFGMEKVSALDADGKTIRVVDASSSASTAPVIKIGIALGGLPSRRDDND